MKATEKMDQSGVFGRMLEGFALYEVIPDANGVPCDYRFLYINPAFERISSLKSDYIVGKTIREVMPDAQSFWFEMFGHVASTGEPIRFERFSLSLNKYLEVSAYAPIKGQCAAIFLDVTERKRMEEALRENEAVLRSFFNSPGQHRGIVEMAGDDILHISVNEVAAAFFGRTKESMRNSLLSTFGVSPEEMAMWRDRYEESKRTGQHVRFEFQYDHENKESWFVARVSYLGDYSGRSRYAYVVTDITGRKKAEADRERLLGELQKALSEVKTLSGLLPICSACKKIRDTAGSWSDVENYIQTRSDAYFSHGICPDCVKTLYPDMPELH